MTQHIFEQIKNGKRHKAVIGWDSPLQQFFGNVFPWVADSKHPKGGYYDIPAWESISCAEKVTLELIRKACESFDIILPDELLRNVANDARLNLGNVVINYAPFPELYEEIKPTYITGR